MVFANASTRMGLPWWMQHVSLPEGKDIFISGRFFFVTWVDLLFPAFLFIMGVVIPPALEKKISKESSMRCITHMVFRKLLLMWLGGVLYEADAYKTGVFLALWLTTGFIAMGALLIDWREKLKTFPGKLVILY